MFATTGLMIAALLQAAPVPAGAEMPATVSPTCPATPVPLPPELADWSRMMPLAAGASADKAAPLTLGAGTEATLLPTPKVTYPVRPEKPGGSVSSGGLFAFVVPAAGRYRVALGSGAWIDVVRDGTASVSASHGHGPDCSGIRKMVDFDLQPGRYLLQIAGNGTAKLPLMVARLP